MKLFHDYCLIPGGPGSCLHIFVHRCKLCILGGTWSLRYLLTVQRIYLLLLTNNDDLLLGLTRALKPGEVEVQWSISDVCQQRVMILIRSILYSAFWDRRIYSQMLKRGILTQGPRSPGSIGIKMIRHVQQNAPGNHETSQHDCKFLRLDI